MYDDDRFRRAKETIKNTVSQDEEAARNSGTNSFQSGLREGMLGAAIVLGGIYLITTPFTSMFWLGPGDKAVINAFGAYEKTVGPGGFHTKKPWPFQRKNVYNVEEIKKREYGYLTIATGKDSTSYADELSDLEGIARYGREGWNELKTKFGAQTKMITAELNIVRTGWEIFYKIVDPVKYQYNIEDAMDLLDKYSEALMRRAVGNRSVFENILSTLEEGRISIPPEVLSDLNEKLKPYDCGILVTQVQLSQTNVADSVKSTLDTLTTAGPIANKKISKAQNIHKRALNYAQGDASNMLSEANAYSSLTQNNAKGLAGRFNAIRIEYEKNKSITAQRMLLETLSTIFQNAGQVYVFPSDYGQQAMPVLLNPSLAQQGITIESKVSATHGVQAAGKTDEMTTTDLQSLVEEIITRATKDVEAQSK